MHWQHPSFFAYFTTASTFEAILGDLYSNAIGSNPGFNVSEQFEQIVLFFSQRGLPLQVVC
jgi:hypothetical protein